MTNYPCLVLDHDDTVVQSTPTIHYPAFMQTLKLLRPEVSWSLEEFTLYNFEPGFEAMCHQLLGFTEQEMKQQEAGWRSYAAVHQPPMFPGMAQIIQRQRAEGGLVCVVSHSQADIIARDYQAHCGFVPDMIFGWELGAEKRKPNPWPLRQILERTGFAPGQLLMVDDLKPGLAMARSCEVPFAFAGWGCSLVPIRQQMETQADHCFTRVQELEALLFGGK